RSLSSPSGETGDPDFLGRIRFQRCWTVGRSSGPSPSANPVSDAKRKSWVSTSVHLFTGASSLRSTYPEAFSGLFYFLVPPGSRALRETPLSPRDPYDARRRGGVRP